MAELALGWALANPNISTLIAGATKISQFESNLRCFNVLPKLTPHVMQKIDAAIGTKPDRNPAYGHGVLAHL
jgi:aryl-alcohol dehydrogenase-like predicted oxidoreductase